jgi:metallo-beta-lactamase class B
VGRWIWGIVAVVALLVGALSIPIVRAAAITAISRDSRPMPPFEIASGLYYVGESDVAVFALKTAEGIVLIDGGYEATAPQVLAKLRALGLDPREVRILLNTHAHYDHAAGLARLKRETGARLYASPADTVLLEAGGRGDFAYGDLLTYPRVRVDHQLHDNEHVTLGALTLTAHFTPGHTKGCTSWSFPVVVDGQTRQALVICSVSSRRYKLTGNLRYPAIRSDYLQSFAILRALPCEVFLGPHARFYGLQKKRAAQLAGAQPNPFLDPAGCRSYIDESERSFHAKLAKELARK